MSTKLAYIIVIIIWSTTPLAIQWSAEGVGFRFGVTSRMVLGVFSTLALLFLTRGHLPRHTQAIKTYLAGGLGIYCAMNCVYWSAQFIPSGWISIVFGSSPLVTGILAAFLLGEDALAPHKLAGIGLGLIGLVITFGEGYSAGPDFLYGVIGVLVGTTAHSLSAVTIKRIGADISGVAVTSGSLLVAVPMYLLTWYLTQSELPTEISPRTAAAIIYLGTIGTAAGFALYYFILKHMEVSRVALIALITPISALALGNVFNEEPITASILLGAACIILGLVCYEFGQNLLASRRTT